MSCPGLEHDRRTFVGLLSVGLAATLAGCSAEKPSPGPTESDTVPPGLPSDPAPPSTAPSTAPSTPSGPLPRVPPPHPGSPQDLTHGPASTRMIALTVDDGFCDDCVGGYVQFAQRSGVHLTFSPNGIYARSWAKRADVLKPLIERGQVQIMNHTFSHKDLRKLTDQQVKDELGRNDDWVVKAFGITTRPYYRPPFGFHDQRVDGIAGTLGFTRTVMWNGSYGDAQLLTPDVLMGEARKWLNPGTIMLGHANHPTVLGLFDQIQRLIADRGLHPVTLDEMFGTSRATG